MGASITPTDGRPAISRGDRAGLWLIAGGAVAVAVLWIVGAVMSAVQTLDDEPLEVRGMELVNASTPPFTEPLAAITGARYETVAVTVAGAPQSVRWLLFGSTAADALAAIGVCLAVVWLCLRLLRRQPFGRSVTFTLMTAAILVMVGGLTSQFLAALARAEVVSFLGPESTGGASTEQPEGYEGFFGLGLSLDLAPLGAGLALGVVALAFQIGARMQRDTEGLV